MNKFEGFQFRPLEKIGDPFMLVKQQPDLPIIPDSTPELPDAPELILDLYPINTGLQL